MIVAPLVTLLALGGARLSWTGDAGATVRVFVNGGLVFGPEAIATAAKTVDVALTDPCTIEVHENESDETVPAASIGFHRRPLLWWSSVAGAATYRISAGGVVLASVLHEPSRMHHEHQVQQDLRVDGSGSPWVAITVEALSSSGRASPVATIRFLAAGAPPAPTDLEVTGTAGSFDIAVEVA